MSAEEHGVRGVSAMTGSPEVAHHGRMGEEVEEAQREPKSALSSAIPQRHTRPHQSMSGWVIMSPAAGSRWLLSPAARYWGHSASKSL